MSWCCIVLLGWIVGGLLAASLFGHLLAAGSHEEPDR